MSRNKQEYGILSYKSSYNLGDEIQSIAAKQFIPNIDYLVDRDTNNITSTLAHNNDRPPTTQINVIYNGWFDGQYTKFPPPDVINPLMISFHINETDHTSDDCYKHKEKDIIEFKPIASNIEYLKRYEPIGCRDTHTCELLNKYGILSYFSGCLTLTLKNNFNTRNDEILIIDSHIMCRELLHNIIPKHIRQKAIYLEQSLEKLVGHNEKMELAQNLLDRIAQAKLVITSRLHTALPALAFKTPVIFLHDNLKDVRFKGILKFLKCYTAGDKLDVDLDHYSMTYKHKENKELDTIIKNLTDTVNRWISANKSHDKKLLECNKDGNSIIAVCMNRNLHLEKSLPTWIASNPNEIILVDWGSKLPIKSIVDKHNHDNKITLITINNVNKWVLTKAYNLAIRFSKYKNILKVDSDTLLDEKFFSYHNLENEQVFFTGDWKQSRNENEKHTNGVIYVKRDLFMHVNGYNEFITTYGYDDSDLYERIDKYAKKLLINLDYIKHIDHSNKDRIINQSSDIRLDVEIEKNRLISQLNIWNGQFSMFHIEKINNNEFLGQFLYSVELEENIKKKYLDHAIKNRDYTLKHHHSPKRFYIKPQNGLGNRLRALASAYNIAKETDRQLIIIWIPDHHCEAKFTDLFKLNYLFKNVTIIEDACKLDLTDTIEYIIFENDHIIKNKIIYNYTESKDKYIDDTTKHDIFVISACVLNNKHTEWYKELLFLKNLEPVDEICSKIYNWSYEHEINEMIGVHIRMGQTPENAKYEDISNYSESAKLSLTKWRNHSHWKVFTKEMDKILQKNPNQKFFLCCDSDEIYEHILNDPKYKSHVFFYKKHVYDRSIQQLQTAVIDVYLLSQTQSILGSNWSSFTELAKRLSCGKKVRLAGVDF
ncbi:MAG: glycosyltransferase [Edafosvirus sp.]|uniref:Glycosyltransferase n=1 Tax=Edafosvirus sp. TaxID=2487765 RepID=A0A3G4ZUI3_9VIRU|nr:MAG: glycosyltransferase [Edafosvirus sp.]